MNIKSVGKNRPCPCGSGKKYKRCCLPKEQNEQEEQNEAVAGNVESGSIIQKIEKEVFDKEVFDEETVAKMVLNFRKLILNRKPHIKEYKKIRKLHSEISSSMINYYDKGNFKQKIDADYKTENNLKDMNKIIFLESDFDFDTDLGFKAFYDTQMYKFAPNMSCITDDYIEKCRYKIPAKIEFLHSMIESKAGLFEVTETDETEGYVYIKEVFTGAEYKIIDIGMSGDEYIEEFYLYMRIMTYCGISFNASSSFIFKKSDSFIKDYIARHKKDYKPLGELLRFTELYNRYSKDKNGVKMVTNTFK